MIISQSILIIMIMAAFQVEGMLFVQDRLPAAQNMVSAAQARMPATASADTIPAVQRDTLQIPSDTIPAAQDTLPAPVSTDTLTAPADTIPAAPRDTIPVPLNTIPTFPGLPSEQDTLPVPADTIPRFPDAPSPQDTIPLQPEPDEVEEPEEIRIVEPWPERVQTGYELAETDSTLRWFMALNWADRLHRVPGVITYRTGRLGQPSGLDIYSYENRHQRLVINEMDATDPVTGQVNWNRVPIHRIRSIQTDSRAFVYQSQVNLREYYTVQPMTFLNFDEGGGDYRNLEFAFTHNFTPETNLELTFWDRRDGDLFPRNSLEGRQIIAKARHNLSDETMLKAGYINNGLDQLQSFGYSVPNLQFYDFNPYNALANESGASSNLTTNDLYVQLLQRSEAGEATRRMAGISYQTDAWSIDFSQDTSAYSLRDVRAFAWQELKSGDASVRARADIYSKKDRSRRSLTSDSWLGWEASAAGEAPLLPGVDVHLKGSYEVRNDGRSGYRTSAGITFEPWNWIALAGFGGTGSAIPSLQSLYWNSIEYQGNELLANESGVFAGISSRIRFGSYLSLGLRADTREVTNGIFLNSTGSFVNIDPYTNLSMSASFDLDSPVFEGSVSATSQEFLSTSINPVNMQLDQSGQRMWFKGSVYWKNYLFNRATFVKAGVSGLFSPGGYAPSDFVVPLNRWQHGSDTRPLPDFHRVDIDIAARIRWFMLLIRYENVLDGVQQLGYFEADAYPMPGRRFIVGFRIVFTN